MTSVPQNAQGFSQDTAQGTQQTTSQTSVRDAGCEYAAELLEVINMPVASPDEHRARFIEAVDLLAEKDNEAVVHLYSGDTCAHRIRVGTFNPIDIPSGRWNARLHAYDPRKARRRYVLGATFGGSDQPAPPPQAAAPAPFIVPQANQQPAQRDRFDDIKERLFEKMLDRLIEPQAASAPPRTPEDDEKRIEGMISRAQKLGQLLNGKVPEEDKGAWIPDLVNAATPAINRLFDILDRALNKPKTPAAQQQRKPVENTAQARTDAGAAGVPSGGEETAPPDAPAETDTNTQNDEDDEESQVFRQCREFATQHEQHESLGDVIAVLVLGHREDARSGLIAARVVTVLLDDWEEEAQGDAAITAKVQETINKVHDLVGEKGKPARNKLELVTGVPEQRIAEVAGIVAPMLPSKRTTHETGKGNGDQLDTRGDIGGAGSGGSDAPGGNGVGGGGGGDGSGDARPAPDVPTTPESVKPQGRRGRRGGVAAEVKA